MPKLLIVSGDDEFLVSETVRKRLSAYASVEVVDSRQSTNEELRLKDIVSAEESCFTPPFLEPSKATWWKNVDFLPRAGVAGPSEAVKKALDKFADKLVSSPLPENQAFAISCAAFSQSSRFAKTLKGIAETIEFKPPKPWEKARENVVKAIDAAKREGLEFEPGAAEAFAAKAGADTRTIASEIAKLRDWLGSGGSVITSAAVAAVVSRGPGTEPAIWDLTDALGARDARRLSAAVGHFQDEKGFALMATSAAEKFYRVLAGMKDASLRGNLAAAAGEMTPFAAKKNAGFLPLWRLDELRAARARMLALRERAVSSAEETVQPLVVAELFRVCRRPSGGGR